MSDLNVYQPWSAPVLHTTLPDKVTQELIQLTDIITKDKKYRESGNEKLAGEIEEEWAVDPILLTNISFKNCVEQLCWEYLKVLVSQHPKRRSFRLLSDGIENIEILSSWFNNQKDNEYNPLHIHEGCSLSAVMYLKVPKFLLPARKSRDEDQDGNIVFYQTPTDSSGGFGYVNRLSLKPKVGDFYVGRY